MCGKPQTTKRKHCRPTLRIAERAQPSLRNSGIDQKSNVQNSDSSLSARIMVPVIQCLPLQGPASRLGLRQQETAWHYLKQGILGYNLQPLFHALATRSYGFPPTWVLKNVLALHKDMTCIPLHTPGKEKAFHSDLSVLTWTLHCPPRVHNELSSGH